MTETVRVPHWTEGSGKALLLHIFMKTGDYYRKGDILFSYSWDGAELEERAYENGKVIAVLFSDGESVEIGTPVIVTETEKNSVRMTAGE